MLQHGTEPLEGSTVRLHPNDYEKQGPAVLRVPTDGGKFAEVEIFEHVKVLGVGGFAVTRGIPGEETYKVTCLRTGFCCGLGSFVSPKAAVESAERKLQDAADARGLTPAKFMEWTRRRARVVLKERAKWLSRS